MRSLAAIQVSLFAILEKLPHSVFLFGELKTSAPIVGLRIIIRHWDSHMRIQIKRVS